ncbi:protein arginine N-methyltransferase 5-like [Littorina saxatilis]|uniref:Protein arginine N-methyltransferase n=1 Tax=Littorina saxatilis TaxID=31220 RepID=A0AAN9GPV6_9CAEN
MPSRLSCGREFHCVPDVNSVLEWTCKSGFDFSCMPIVHPRLKREFLENAAKNRGGPLTRSDLCLPCGDWNNLVVGKVSPWLKLDSPHHHVRRTSELGLKQELSFAAHLGMPAVMIPVNNANCCNLARALNEHILSSYVPQQYWIHIPLMSASDMADKLFKGEDDAMEGETFEDTWQWWNIFRTLCDSTRKLDLVLELTADIPAEAMIERWLSEPLKAILVSTKLFLTNKKGYPVLSKPHQNLIRKLFKLDVQVILTGVDRHPEKGIRCYQQYLDHLWQTQEPPDPVTEFSKGFEDFLQCPLQPLMDNLESHTYEVFEKDPVKYSEYQRAIFTAVIDKVPEAEKDTKELILMVVGAGRGPLVRAAITALKQANRKAKKIYAVEKNPNAVVTLENMRDEMWGPLVEVVSCDMRNWDAPEKCDILISELLGSFGDNELSPECLDGAQRFLKDDGISIPSDYTSYMAPLQSARLYNEFRVNKDKDKPAESSFEMPYVVRLHNCQMLAEPQKVFQFHHPNRDAFIDNNRYKSMTFDIAEDCVIHGLAGYFDTVLYKDVTLSILPSTHSPGMFSWFPILFPLRTPTYVTKGTKVVIDIWRRVTEKNVWYEWTMVRPQPLPLHNPKGRSYTIGL